MNSRGDKRKLPEFMFSFRSFVFSLALFGLLCGFIIFKISPEIFEITTFVLGKNQDKSIDQPSSVVLPVVINTWHFTGATDAAYSILVSPRYYSIPHIDALEAGLHWCEEGNCDGATGRGGSPDENGETTLDALMIDGDTMEMGAVSGLRRVNNAIGVARAVKDHTLHSVLVGDLATEFALGMGFHSSSLTTNSSLNQWKDWLSNHCQPNFRKNTIPDAKSSCGPYKPAKNKRNFGADSRPSSTPFNHDTIGMVVLSATSSIAAGGSTNGATFKVPGRVGDIPIVGAGAYADSHVGGCAATGDGDIMMRFLPCFLTIENMRMGMPLQQAADQSLLRIAKYFPSYKGALVVLSVTGKFTGSAYGWEFTYSARTPQMNTTIFHVKPLPAEPINRIGNY